MFAPPLLIISLSLLPPLISIVASLLAGCVDLAASFFVSVRQRLPAIGLLSIMPENESKQAFNQRPISAGQQSAHACWHERAGRNGSPRPPPPPSYHVLVGVRTNAQLHRR